VNGLKGRMIDGLQVRTCHHRKIHLRDRPNWKSYANKARQFAVQRGGSKFREKQDDARGDRPENTPERATVKLAFSVMGHPMVGSVPFKALNRACL
jgi:hypothetical protein